VAKQPGRAIDVPGRDGASGQAHQTGRHTLAIVHGQVEPQAFGAQRRRLIGPAELQRQEAQAAQRVGQRDAVAVAA
jgi:hypothetical protein